MQKNWIVLVGVWVWSATGVAAMPGFGGLGHQQNSLKTNVDFFEQTVRRRPTELELLTVPVFDTPTGNCASFWIKNSQNKMFLGVGRHCADYKLTEYCQKNKIKIRTATGEIGQCTRIVAADHATDMGIIEVGFAKLPQRIGALALASFHPVYGDRMSLIGYPGDKFAIQGGGGLWVSENCWLQSNSFYPIDDSRFPNITDRKGQHNCTLYYGNSGGPFVLEGTSIAVGFPGYVETPNKLTQESFRPSDESELGIIPWFYFVRRFRDVLIKEGIEIVNERPQPRYQVNIPTQTASATVTTNVGVTTYAPSVATINLPNGGTMTTITFEPVNQARPLPTQAHKAVEKTQDSKFAYLRDIPLGQFLLRENFPDSVVCTMKTEGVDTQEGKLYISYQQNPLSSGSTQCRMSGTIEMECQEYPSMLCFTSDGRMIFSHFSKDGLFETDRMDTSKTMITRRYIGQSVIDQVKSQPKFDYLAKLQPGIYDLNGSKGTCRARIDVNPAKAQVLLIKVPGTATEQCKGQVLYQCLSEPFNVCQEIGESVKGQRETLSEFDNNAFRRTYITHGSKKTSYQYVPVK